MLETEAMFDAKQFENDSFLSEMRELSSIFSKTILEWKGGVCVQSLTFNNLTPDVWLGWIYSLYKSPIVLRHDTRMPIHQFVSLLSNEISVQVKLSSNFHVDVSDVPKLELNVPDETDDNRTRESAARKSISKTLSRAIEGFPATATVIQGTSENFTTKVISEIKLGDRVLCKGQSGLEFQEVTKVNCAQEEVVLNYIYMKHEHGELLAGYNHNIILPTGEIPAKYVQIENTLSLVVIDKTKMNTQNSKVTYVGTGIGEGRYSLKMDNASAYLAVDQVLIGDVQTTCFPGNATVLLKGGKRVRMDELKIGDYVLSIHPTTFKPVYSKVYLWAHRDILNTTTFLHITHPYGHLHISANHLILSGDDKTPIPAHQLRVGDSIHFMSHSLLQKKLDGNDEMDSHSLIPVSVLHIHSCIQVGYYSPFTDNGLVVVDNIATSVYSQIPVHSQSGYTTRPLIHKFGMHAVAHCVLTPVRVGCKLGMRSLLSDQIDENSHIHKYCRWLFLHC